MADSNLDKSFLGTGWGFPPQFESLASDNLPGVQLVSDDDDIRESLYILLSTVPGERIMLPDYGCGIKTLVFEPLDDLLIGKLRVMIENSILLYEPRINLENIEILPDKDTKGLLKIELDYTLRKTNTRSNMVYPFYLQEGTDV